MPDYSLRVFGCLCYPNLSATTRHKLSPRSMACVFSSVTLLLRRATGVLTSPLARSSSRDTSFFMRLTFRLRPPSPIRIRFIFFVTGLPTPPPSTSDVGRTPAVVDVEDPVGLAWRCLPAAPGCSWLSGAPAVRSSRPCGAPAGRSCTSTTCWRCCYSCSSTSCWRCCTGCCRCAATSRWRPAHPSRLHASTHPIPPTAPPPEPPPAEMPPPRETKSRTGSLPPPIQCYSFSATSSSPASPLPANSRAALADPNWRAAMNEEYKALMDNGTWRLVPRPPRANVITGKWVFKHKYHADGSLANHKARWVVRGFS